MVPQRRSAILGLLRFTRAVEDALLVFLLAAMILVAGTQIFLRNLFDTSLLWADPLLRVAVLWVGMIGAMVATRSDRQISIDAVSKFLPLVWKARIRVLTDLFTATVAAVLAWNAGRLVLDDHAAGALVMNLIPLWVCEVVLPVAFGIIAVRYALFAIQHLRIGVTGEEPT